MFNSILKPAFQILTQGMFSPYPDIKRLASIAGCCLILLLVFTGYTTWISQPAYSNMINHNLLGWVMSGSVAYFMFAGTGTISAFCAESILDTKHILNGNLVLLIAALVCALGIFDAYKGYAEGSVHRSEDLYKEASFTEVNTSPLPYEAEIGVINEQIASLQNERIPYKGEMVKPWGNNKKIDLLLKEKESYTNLRSEIEKSNIDTYRKREKIKDRDRFLSQKSNQMVSIWLYFLMIPIGIVFHVFIIKMDLIDGVRDGKITPSFNLDNPYGFPEADSNNREGVYMYEEEETKPKTFAGSVLSWIFGNPKASRIEKEKQEDSNITIGEGRRYLEKYKEVIPDLNLTYSEIQEKHKISPSTIRKLRSIKRELGEFAYYEDLKKEK